MQGLTQVNSVAGVKGLRGKHVAEMAQRIIGPSSAGCARA
jgi:hypothetical protein